MQQLCFDELIIRFGCRQSEQKRYSGAWPDWLMYEVKFVSLSVYAVSLMYMALWGVTSARARFAHPGKMIC